MGKRLTKEEINRRLEEYEITFLRDAPKSKHGRRGYFRCSNGHEWNGNLSHVSLGRTSCPECDRLSRTHDSDYINDAVKERKIYYIEDTEDSTGKNRRVLMGCYVCGNKWKSYLTNTLNGGNGCPNCARSNRLLGIEYVIKSLEDNGYEYVGDYKYKGSTEYHYGKCDKHGIFGFMPTRYRNEGSLCPECGFERGWDKLRKDISEIRQYMEMVGYTLLSKMYVNSSTPLKIECPEGHVYSTQSWSNFKSGSRCPICSKGGFNPLSPAILYYMSVKHRNKEYYKIGITNKSVEKRYSKTEMEKIRVIKIWSYKKGKSAYTREQNILKKFSKFKYSGRAKIFNHTGNSEVFTKDVLGLDGGIGGEKK